MSLALFLIVVSVGTGLYILAPSIAYIAVVLSCIFLLLSHSFVSAPLRYVAPRMVGGYLVFNSLFLVHSLFFHLDTRRNFVTLISLGLFLLVYVYSMLVFRDQTRRPLDRRVNLVAVMCISALLVLLLGQAAEMMGYLDRRALEPNDTHLSLTLRPGGFLNPNVTAAIALVFFYSSAQLDSRMSRHLTAIALVLTTMILLLSQSRAALIVLAAYLMFLSIKHGPRFMAVAGVLLAIVAFVVLTSYELEIQQLFDATIARFGGDESSAARREIVIRGVSAFADAPLLGNGYRYLESAIGTSAHNEVLENLVNFGIIGTVVVLTASYLLYLPISLSFLLVCVMPTFLFSHNFFETTAFQASLGFALAIERTQRRNRFVGRQGNN